MASSPKAKITAAEYRALERAAHVKNEFYDGEMFAMSGASRHHARLQIDLAVETATHLSDTSCEIFGSDLRVKIPATGLYTYPDCSIVCGTAEFEDQAMDTLLNPTVLVEILSPSTEAYDRGQKFRHYRTIASLQEYILVSQDAVLVEQYTRADGGVWQLRTYSDRSDHMHLESIGASLSLAAIYRRIPLEL